MMENYYPEGFIPSTGGSIRIVPVELPTVTLKYQTYVQAGSEFDVEVSVSDYDTFPIMLLLDVKNDITTLSYGIAISSEKFIAKLKAPLVAGKYNIKLQENNVYLFNNKDIVVVDYLC